MIHFSNSGLMKTAVFLMEIFEISVFRLIDLNVIMLIQHNQLVNYFDGSNFFPKF